MGDGTIKDRWKFQIRRILDDSLTRFRVPLRRFPTSKDRNSIGNPLKYPTGSQYKKSILLNPSTLIIVKVVVNR